MGADGGTIPTRCELVQTRKKPEQKDKDSVRIYKWQFCSLTQQPLVRPIVACELGRLYNKEPIIEKLLEAKAEKNTDKPIEESVDHIKTLKDVKELQLTDNPAYNRNTKANTTGGEGFIDRQISPYICPITGLEMNGRFKFIFDWTNGKVISERALKIVNNDAAVQIKEEDLIILNPEEKSEEAERMITKMEARRARAKAAKKALKEAKRKHDKNSANGIDMESNGIKSDSKSVMLPPASTSSSLANSTSKEGESEIKRTKIEFSSQKVVNGLKGPISKNHALKNKDSKGSTKGSVQNDPSKSEVFKSLFSSHKSAESKPKGHWITFDPRYN